MVKSADTSLSEDEINRVEAVNTASAAAEEFVSTAKTYIKKGHFEEAIKQYGKAVEVDVRNRKKYFAAIGYLNYRWYHENKASGLAQNDLRPLKDAIGYLLDAAKIDTSFVEAIKLIAKIYESEKIDVAKALNEKELFEVDQFLKQHWRFS